MSLSPILLSPVFRYDSATPWGGNQLKTLYHKNTPSDIVGESLEMSVLKNLESTDAYGNSLSCLIEKYGSALTGTDSDADFPLLLKLIDAKDRLSVQVHPDDAYAAANEGKLGKTEAWVILKAEEGAQLVYGVKEGVTKDMLRDAFAAHLSIEPYLRFVPVHPGEVYFIPAGMLHAIGGGIILYEIQQTSDVTYRFYDWNRVNAKGESRPLHIEKGLDVLRTDLQLKAAVSQVLPDDHCTRELLLNEKYFSLERLKDCLSVPFHAKKTHFSVLTALSEGEISEKGKKTYLPAGQTVLIPADCNDFTLSGPHFLLSYPSQKDNL